MTKMAKWYKIAQIEDVPSMGSRKVIIGEIEIAIFKTKDGSIFAINPDYAIGKFQSKQTYYKI